MSDINNRKRPANKSTSGNRVNYPYKNANGQKTAKGTRPTNSNAKKQSAKKVALNKKKKKRSLPFRIFKWTFFTIFFLCLTFFVIGLGYVFAIIKSTAPLDVDAVKNLSSPTSVYDNDGKLMDTLNSEVDRNIISFNEMPDDLKHAFVAIEDQRFYEHNGIDVIRIAGSMVTDAKKLMRGERGFHGGSTITQQLLKNTILTNETSTIERKVKEIYLALNLEKQLSKDEILHLYLNTIPMAGTSYGVDAGAKLYFGKSAHDLNLIECAYLAGINQAPTYYSAYNNTNTPNVYLNRTKTVLAKMKELNYINQAQYDKAISDLNNGGLVFKSEKNSYSLEYEWYINPAVKQVKKDLMTKFKYSNEEATKLLANGGLKIYTNMDRELQDYAQQVLNDTYVYNNNEVIPNSNTPAFQGACTVVDYHTGEVKVIIGGRGEHGAQSTNRATDELRSTGSTIKPLTVYGPAINEKVFTAASILDDAPIPESIGKLYPNSDGSPYNPQNDDKQYSGNITLREGLRQSKNVIAVLVENQLGLDVGKSYGEKLGIKFNSTYTGIAALALGEFPNNPNDPDGANPYILANAYGTLGNGGQYTEPRLYSKVVDAYGNTLLQTSAETTQVFSEDTSYIVYDMLKGSCATTGPSAKWGSMPVAGKTGTSTNFKNLWFSGLTPYYSGSVWLGYYNSSVNLNRQYGLNSDSAASVWGKIMAKAHEQLEVKDIEMPSDLVTLTVCKDSGKLPTKSCYNTYTEYFIKGTEPTSYCTYHSYYNYNQYNSNNNNNNKESSDKDNDKNKSNDSENNTDTDNSNNDNNNIENNLDNNDMNNDNSNDDENSITDNSIH